MLKWSRERQWIAGGFALAMLLMTIVSLLSYQNAIQLVNIAQQVNATNEMLQTLTDISATLTDADSKRRDYLLYGDTSALPSYNATIQGLQTRLEDLRLPFKDTPIQEQRLNELKTLVNQRLALFQDSIQRFQGKPIDFSPRDPLIIQTLQNQDRIRRLVTELRVTEEQLLDTYANQVEANLRSRMFIELLGTLLTFAVLLGVFVALYRQIMKRQQAEQVQRALTQAKELSELKLQFFSMVSHEFRTPLSLILGSAQLLGESLKQIVEPTKLKNLYRIQSSAKLMTQLLNDILTLARADAGKLDFIPEMIEIQTFCLNLVEDFQCFSEPKRSIQFITQGHCTYAKVDEKLLYSILSNLLSNAIKYSEPDRPVALTLICKPSAIVFQIRDEGIGIPPEEIPLLYDPFSRGKQARETLGTGLGLAVVKKCLDLHQGSITVESNVGVGTTFTVTIPQHPHLN